MKRCFQAKYEGENFIFHLKRRRHTIQHNDIQHNDTQNNGPQQNDTQDNGT